MILPTQSRQTTTGFSLRYQRAPVISIPAGASSSTFTIATQPVTQATSIELQASCNGQSRTVRLTILPPVVVGGAGAALAQEADVGADGEEDEVVPLAISHGSRRQPPAGPVKTSARITRVGDVLEDEQVRNVRRHGRPASRDEVGPAAKEVSLSFQVTWL